MRCRGAIAFLLILTLVFGGISAYSIQIPHKNFSEADEDLFSIVSFLSDSKYLCEQSLLSSYNLNCTIFFNKNIIISYDKYQLNLSLEKSKELQQKLRYSSDVLDKLKNKAGSYENLKDFLLPIKYLGDNATLVVTNHTALISSFQNLTFIVNSKAAGDTTFLNNLTNAHNALATCKKGIDSINFHVKDISSFYSTESLENILIDLQDLLKRYESYINIFGNFFSYKEYPLILIAEKTDVYLGESVTLSGFFITESGFVSNHEIFLKFDNLTFNSTSTDHIGRYETILQTSINDDPISHTVSAFTFFNGTKYNSDIVLITLHKIPTKLVLKLSKNQFKQNESIIFSGQLCTYKNVGIQGSVQLSYHEYNQFVLTNSSGNFTYLDSNIFPYGEYSVFATYVPKNIYEPCMSDTIKFYVNIPTKLSITVNNKNLTVGDTINVRGRLQDSISTDLISGKSIHLFLNNRSIKSVITNESGDYLFSLKLDNVESGTTRIYTRYVSDDLQWRSCISKTIDLNISSGLLEKILGNILIPAIILIISIILFLIIIYKNRISSAIKFHQKDLLPSSSLSFISKYIGKKPYSLKTNLSQNDVYTDPSIVSKQKIITKYRLLLRYLSSRGLRFSPNATHLDIQKKLKTTGMEEKAVNSVTNTFEYTRYSQHLPKEDDADLFDKNVFSIITDFRK